MQHLRIVAPTMPFMNVAFLHGIGFIIPIVIRLKSTGLNVLHNINLTCKDRFIRTYALERPDPQDGSHEQPNLEDL